MSTWKYAIKERSSQRFLILAFLFLVCALTGGSYRPDAGSLLVLRPAVITGISLIFLLPGEWDWAPFRPLLGLLGLFAVTMVIQLVPLPPDIWLKMPGHAQYAMAAAEKSQPWRPISLTPDLTINSLLALLPATAVVVAFAGMRMRQRFQTIWLITGIAFVSAVLGVIQIADGPASMAYFYDVGGDGLPVGFLANRNHQALLLACGFPMLGYLVGTVEDRPGLVRAILALAVSVLLLLTILVTGSRAGLALALVGISSALFMVPLPEALRRRGRITATHVAFLVAPLLLIFGVAQMGRAVSINRLAADNLLSELRLQLLPINLRITADYMPFGIGYGAFDPVFRAYEPDALLSPKYVNRAHNDLIELLMTGGLPAALPLCLFLMWFMRNANARWKGLSLRSPMFRLTAAATIVIAMMLMASLVDYPLRTGLLSMIFASACCWLAGANTRSVDAPHEFKNKRRRNPALI